MNFVEQATQFGCHRALVGIVTEPAESSKEMPVVVILNTGTIHRVGHHRMYVALARKLAAAGNTVLRFDFSGVGDSARGPGTQTLIESNLSDIRAALDWLESTHDLSKAILIGLCSGADHALLYGRSDPRVAGLVLIDPYIPATVWYFRDYISKRLFDLNSWKRFNLRNSKIISRMSEFFFSPYKTDMTSPHLVPEGSNIRRSLEKIYRATVQARIQLLVVCTGGDYAPRQTYREQFTNAFSGVSFGDLLRLEYFEEADHTFRSPGWRRELTNVVEDWCKATNFARSASSGSAHAAEGSEPRLTTTKNAFS